MQWLAAFKRPLFAALLALGIVLGTAAVPSPAAAAAEGGDVVLK